jgi:hypothetical protein
MLPGEGEGRTRTHGGVAVGATETAPGLPASSTTSDRQLTAARLPASDLWEAAERPHETVQPNRGAQGPCCRCHAKSGMLSSRRKSKAGKTCSPHREGVRPSIATLIALGWISGCGNDGCDRSSRSSGDD